MADAYFRQQTSGGQDGLGLEGKGFGAVAQLDGLGGVTGLDDEGFEAVARQLVRWITGYRKSLVTSAASPEPQLSIRSAVQPGYLYTLLPE